MSIEKELSTDPVGLWTRLWAFQIDAFLFWLIIILPTVLFVQDRLIPDGITDIIGFTILFLYFWLMPQFGKATVGQHLLGYKIVPVTGKTANYPIRILLSIPAFMMNLATLAYYQKDTTGIYWWDSLSNTRAVRTIP